MGSLRNKFVIFALLFSSTFFSDQLTGAVEEVLTSISERAYESNSATLLIMHKGNFISTEGCRCLEPMDVRSVTKSFLSLAVGLLMQDGLLTSLETPIYHYFPEWKQGNKQFVMIRHLLSHTSGLGTDVPCKEIYQFPDAVRMALASDLCSPPDTRFIYNNIATNLLAGVIEKATGMSVHAYLKKQLFEPLCINSDSWLCDNVGNNYGMSHLSINSVDLMKIGQLVANNGCWNGRRILSAEWIELMLQPSQLFTPFYGPLWWLGYYSISIHWDSDVLDQYDAAGIPCEYIQALQNTQGRVLVLEGHICYGNFLQQCVPQLAPYFGSQQAVYDFFAMVESKGLMLGKWDTGKVKSISARGYLGQQLIVFPEDKIVAVRLSNSTGTSNETNDNFSELENWLALLIYEMNCYVPTDSFVSEECQDAIP